MGDFRNTTGITHAGPGSSVSFGRDTIGLIKWKPGGVSEDKGTAYEAGVKEPVAHIDGPIKLDNMTATVAAAQWEQYTTAHPRWLGEIIAVSASYIKDGLPPVTYQQRRACIISAKPSETSGESAAQAAVDIEIKPLGVASNNKEWK